MGAPIDAFLKWGGEQYGSEITNPATIHDMLVPDPDDSQNIRIQKNTRLGLAISQVLSAGQSRVLLPFFQGEELDITMTEVDIIDFGGITHAREGLIGLIIDAAQIGILTNEDPGVIIGPEREFEAHKLLSRSPNDLLFYYNTTANILSWRQIDTILENEENDEIDPNRELKLTDYERVLLYRGYMERVGVVDN